MLTIIGFIFGLSLIVLGFWMFYENQRAHHIAMNIGVGAYEYKEVRSFQGKTKRIKVIRQEIKDRFNLHWC